MTCRLHRNAREMRPYYGDEGEPERLPSRLRFHPPDRHPARSWLFALALLGAIIVGTAVAWPADLPSPSENAWLRTWIPHHCCVTNNCCYRVTNGEVKGIGGDRWQVVATKQILPRTAWSRDGDLWLCACDQIEGQWTVHPKAEARCVFPQKPSM